VLVLTVDLPAGRNTETERRFARADTRQCSSCHQPGLPGFVRRKPMFDRLDLTGVGLLSPGLTWEVIRRLKDTMKMKLVLKGIETREDAELCLQHGIDGVIVSNHGGRAEESGRGTIVPAELIGACSCRGRGRRCCKGCGHFSAAEWLWIIGVVQAACFSRVAFCGGKCSSTFRIRWRKRDRD